MALHFHKIVKKSRILIINFSFFYPTQDIKVIVIDSLKCHFQTLKQIY